MYNTCKYLQHLVKQHCKVQVGDAILSSTDNATNYKNTTHISQRLERSIVTPPVPLQQKGVLQPATYRMSYMNRNAVQTAEQGCWLPGYGYSQGSMFGEGIKEVRSMSKRFCAPHSRCRHNALSVAEPVLMPYSL